MKSKIKNISGCSRTLNIEVSSTELIEKFEQVYKDIGRSANLPGFRRGKAPRDLLELHYSEKAKEEVIRRAIPQYYLKAVNEERLTPVAPPEIENVQFKDHAFYFSARVDVRPEVKLKSYKGLRLKKRKVKVEAEQVEQALERLRQSKAKDAKNVDRQEKALPELNDAFAQDLGFATVQELKDAIDKDLRAHTEMEIQREIKQQLLDQLLQRASLDTPESLIKAQMQESLKQLKMNRMLRGEKKEDIETKQKELEAEARKEAVQRIRLSFILEEVGQLEDIQADEKGLAQRIAEISQHTGRPEDEVRQYLDKQNLIPGLKAELREKKIIEFLLQEAKIEEEK
ncbi:MAG: hypothetical protein NG712_04110 [Omnitrophica bacterium]|nr:hypothetical protein [Candidatus Omnitrophota bacterium]